MACGMLNFGSNALILSALGKCAENRVFAPNISVVENNSVVLAIDCWGISNLVFTKEGPYTNEGAEQHDGCSAPLVYKLSTGIACVLTR